jgi:hypothetical protein
MRSSARLSARLATGTPTSVSYLLQRMEEYEGVAILASNLRQHLDDAVRRWEEASNSVPDETVDTASGKESGHRSSVGR